MVCRIIPVAADCKIESVRFSARRILGLVPRKAVWQIVNQSLLRLTAEQYAEIAALLGEHSITLEPATKPKTDEQKAEPNTR
jgi:hypothetical protein